MKKEDMLFNSNEEFEIFVKENNLTRSQEPLSKKEIEALEIVMGVKMGEQLKEYFTKYGYLENAEGAFYGVKRNDFMDEESVPSLTRRINKLYPETKGLVCFGCECDDEDCVALANLVDSNDIVYLLVIKSEDNKADCGRLVNLNEKLFDFMAKRLVHPELMNCKNCGSDYTSLRTTCPYCEAPKATCAVSVEKEFRKEKGKE